MTPATSSRRSALCGGVAAALAGLTVATTARASTIPATDAGLIAIEKELESALAEQAAVFAVCHTIADEERLEPQIMAIAARIEVIEQRIGSLGMPETMAGAMAMTRIGLMSAHRDCNDGCIVAGDFPELMAWSVLEWLADQPIS